MDIAEQLAAEVESWFTNLGVRGQVPRAFTGVTRDGRQLIIVLDGIPLDRVERRDFLIWLSHKHSLIAYAYATRVKIMKGSHQGLVEALDINASSFARDVFLTLLIDRQPDGSIKYVRDFYQSETAKAQADQIFSGLHRSDRTLSHARSEKFEKLWRTWQRSAHWQMFHRAR